MLSVALGEDKISQVLRLDLSIWLQSQAGSLLLTKKSLNTGFRVMAPEILFQLWAAMA